MVVRVALILSLLACTRSNAEPEDKMTPPTNPPGAKPGKPTSTLDQVKQAYSHDTVGKSAITVTGVELFEVTSDGPLAADQERVSQLVAIVGGVGSPILEGADVTRAVIKASNDPLVLAKVALAVSMRAADVLTAPKTDEQKKANVGPPTVSGNTVTFWLLTRGMGRELLMGKLDTTTATLTFGGPPTTPSDQIGKAIEALAGTSLAMHQHAITTLVANCTDTKARDALFDAMAHHKREETRAAAVDASPGCGAAAIDTLIGIMEKDASSTVKWKAAKALGDIGDSKAKPALEKASQSSDANVKSAATRALGKLK